MFPSSSTCWPTLSRSHKPVLTEWTLSLPVFNSFVPTYIFCNLTKQRLPTFVSPVPDEESLAVDAFSNSWDGMNSYAFPLFNLVGKVIQKFRSHSCLLTLIAPLAFSDEGSSTTASSSRGSGVPTSVRSVSLEAGNSPSSRLEAIQSRLLTNGFSAELPTVSFDRSGLPLLPST